MLDILGYGLAVVLVTYMYLLIPFAIIVFGIRCWINKGGLLDLIPTTVNKAVGRIVNPLGAFKDDALDPNVVNLSTMLGFIFTFFISIRILASASRDYNNIVEGSIDTIHKISIDLSPILSYAIIITLVWYVGIFIMKGISWVRSNIEALKKFMVKVGDK